MFPFLFFGLRKMVRKLHFRYEPNPPSPSPWPELLGLITRIGSCHRRWHTLSFCEILIPYLSFPNWWHSHSYCFFVLLVASCWVLFINSTERKTCAVAWEGGEGESEMDKMFPVLPEINCFGGWKLYFFFFAKNDLQSLCTIGMAFLLHLQCVSALLNCFVLVFAGNSIVSWLLRNI